MTNPDQTPVDALEALGRMTAHDVDPWRAARLRRELKTELARAQAAASPWRTAARVGRQVLEPAAAVLFGTVYLAWAVQAVLVIKGGVGL